MKILSIIFLYCFCAHLSPAFSGTSPATPKKNRYPYGNQISARPVVSKQATNAALIKKCTTQKKLKQKPTPDCLAAQKQNATQVLKGNKSVSINKKSQTLQKPSNKTSSKMQKPATAQVSQKKSWSLFGKKQDASANGQAPKKKGWSLFRNKQDTSANGQAPQALKENKSVSITKKSQTLQKPSNKTSS